MTNLPTIDIGRLAIDYARAEVVRLNQPGNPWNETGRSQLDTGASTDFIRNFFKQALQYPVGRLGIMELARAGISDAHDMLCEFINEIESRDLSMPTELRGYRMEIVAGFRPTHAPAQKKYQDIVRNICITILVDDLRKYFAIKPLGRSGKRRSGCAIVAEALGEANMVLSEEAIRSIWKCYGRIIAPPVFAESGIAYS